MLYSDSVSSYDGARSRKVSLVTRNASCSLVAVQKASLGVRYPPLPKWMERRVSGAKRDEGSVLPERWGERRPLVPKWMEKLPGNMKGLRRRGDRVVSGGGVEKRLGKRS